jgi:hypothetical protein
MAWGCIGLFANELGLDCEASSVTRTANSRIIHELIDEFVKSCYTKGD